ncbi:hypothetical protein SAURM35S_00482 [Streptomyces aurantiogriseus]
MPADEVTTGSDVDAARVRTGPRHAAPKKPLFTRLHMPAGKAIALAAMPTAVLMGMGFTPTLANAEDQPSSKNLTIDEYKDCVAALEDEEDASALALAVRLGERVGGRGQDRLRGRATDDGAVPPTDSSGSSGDKDTSGDSSSDSGSDGGAEPAPSASASASTPEKSASSSGGDTATASPSPSETDKNVLETIGDAPPTCSTARSPTRRPVRARRRRPRRPTGPPPRAPAGHVLGLRLGLRLVRLRQGRLGQGRLRHRQGHHRRRLRRGEGHRREGGEGGRGHHGEGGGGSGGRRRRHRLPEPVGERLDGRGRLPGRHGRRERHRQQGAAGGRPLVPERQFAAAQGRRLPGHRRGEDGQRDEEEGPEVRHLRGHRHR